ncbi:MAG: nucleotidyltransferase domain-containing protein [Nanoarchaeota archaeon]|nr:nucleotidyltransferase domain-containing protein [Nanoarchaeota archaeon]
MKTNIAQAGVEMVVKEISKHKEVKAVYLFGSYARGEHTSLSDIDICVITGYNLKKAVKEDILSNGSEKIDISIFSDLPITIKYKVFKEGIKLMDRDKNFLHDRIMSTLWEYFDFQPALRRFAKAVGVSYE